MSQTDDNAGSSTPSWIAAANGAEDRPVSMDFTPLLAHEKQAPSVEGGVVPVAASSQADSVDPASGPCGVIEQPQQCDTAEEKLVGVFIHNLLWSGGSGPGGYGVDFGIIPKYWRFGRFEYKEIYDDDDDQDPRIRLTARETDKLLYEIGEILSEYADLVSCTGAIRADRIPEFHNNTAIQHILVVPQSVAARLTDGEADVPSFFKADLKIGDISKPALTDVEVSIWTSGYAPIEDIFAALKDLDPAEANANFGGPTTPERLPRPGESCADWADRVCVSKAQCDEIEALWEQIGKNPTLMKAAMSAMSDEIPAIPFVSADLMPDVAITLLVGKAGCGKSTLSAEFAHKVSTHGKVPQQQFLGTDISKGGMVLVFAGEGGRNIWLRRLAIMGRPHNVIVLDASQMSLTQVVENALSVTNVALVIVDPVSKWLSDENDNGACGQLMGQLEYLTSKTGCAVLAVHHPKKGTHRTIAAMGEAIRGGSVLVDRPRMVLAMIDKGDGQIDVGIVKSNVGNAWGANGQPRRFRRNAEQMTLEDAQGAATAKYAPSALPDACGADFDALVAETVSQLTLAGRKVRRTGENSVYSNRAGALASASRKVVEQAVDRLISSGVLQIADGGISLQNHAS